MGDKHSNLLLEIHRIRRMMLIDEEIEHLQQPTGNSCGPTCIKMVGDFIKGDVGSIDEICITCGTDWVVGTPPDKMKRGLDELGISYIEHIREIEPFQSLRNIIDKGNVAIVRTITHNIPHWIVIASYQDEYFLVNDPWLGQIRYNEVQLESIWKVREFFFFEIITGYQKIAQDVIVRQIQNEDLPIIYDQLSDVFNKTRLDNRTIWHLLGSFSPTKTVVAEVNGELAGFYFLGDEQIPPGGDGYDTLKNLVGIEGIALGVFRKFKNMGVGKKLIQYSQNISGVDYVWGYQFKSLKNIDDWLKRRKIYGETESLYITYQILNKKGTK